MSPNNFNNVSQGRGNPAVSPSLVTGNGHGRVTESKSDLSKELTISSSINNRSRVVNTLSDKNYVDNFAVTSTRCQKFRPLNNFSANNFVQKNHFDIFL